MEGLNALRLPHLEHNQRSPVRPCNILTMSYMVTDHRDEIASKMTMGTGHCTVSKDFLVSCHKPKLFAQHRIFCNIFSAKVLDTISNPRICHINKLSERVSFIDERGQMRVHGLPSQSTVIRHTCFQCFDGTCRRQNSIKFP